MKWPVVLKKKVNVIANDAKSKEDNDLYHKLGNRDGEMCVYKFARIKGKKCKDLDHVNCFKSEDQRVLVKDNEIK